MGMLIVAIGSFAQTFTVDGLKYEVLSAEDKTAQVTDGKSATGDIVIPQTVTYENTEYSVTTIYGSAFKNAAITSLTAPFVKIICSSAFYGCTSLASVSLPAVTSIGEYAFRDCENINSLRIGSLEQWCKVNLEGRFSSPLQNSKTVNLYIDDSETPTTEIVVPSTITDIPDYAFINTTITSLNAPTTTSIGQYAFNGCSSLESVSLPTVTSIGCYAFCYCENISSLCIGSVEQWCKVNFNGDFSSPLRYASKKVNLYIGDSETPTTEIVVPSTITNIPNESFLNTTITSLNAPAVTTIGSYAFYGCSSLASVSLPAVTSIDSYAFRECSSLTLVSLPSATSIGEGAFWNCSALTSVSLSVTTSVGGSAFQNCSALTSVAFPAVTSIGGYALSNCSLITHLELPEAKEIASGAFSGMRSLKYLSIPKVEKIGEFAFNGVTIDTLRIGSLEQYFNIEYKNTDISSYDYCYQFPLYSAYNSNLMIGDAETVATEITIPSDVQKIPEYAFNGTTIHTIHFVNNTPPTLTNLNSFSTRVMLAVPDEAYETYLATDVYKNIPLRITKESYITQEIEIEAESTTSKLLEKIGEDKVKYVVNLKVTGTINSYDMLIIRNQMTSLRNLDLTDATIVDCDYVYSNSNGINYHSEKDVITADWLSGIMNIKLPSTTKSIGAKAFYNCSNLVSATIPDGVTSIGNYAFYGCNRIQNLSLPQSIISFGSYAFEDCKGLKEIIIPNGVTSVGSCAFYRCKDLVKVTIPASVTEIGSSAFNVTNPLTLCISDLTSWLNININGYVFDNISKLYIGNSKEPTDAISIPTGTTELKNSTFEGFQCIKSISLPEELLSIGSRTFYGCKGLSNIELPNNLKTIDRHAFAECCNLENIEFNDSLKTIDSYAFWDCTNLEKVDLPPYLKSIGEYAFQYCSKIAEVLIPASIEEIGDYAFSGCSNLNTVIATTVEPVTINENTFSTYKTATLYSPKTSYYKYYWNTQYNQFLSRQEYDQKFNHHFPYKYFYLNGKNGDNDQDFEITDETGHIHGVADEETGIEKAPDADFNQGAGMIVDGDEIQELGDVHIHHNGNHGASVIGKGNGKAHFKNIYADIKVEKNKWYFFSFPFDMDRDKVTFPGSHVWYSYDGNTRALNGNGGWKKLGSSDKMEHGHGYIFQGAIDGTISLHATDVTIDASDCKTTMETHVAENKNDASWNLIGNSNIAYYDLDNLDYDAPITVYDNETGNYKAIRHGDDDYEFYPFQAFFVQKPESKTTMDFIGTKKETKNMAEKNAAAKAAAKAKAPKNVSATRKVINLELVSNDIVADSVAVASDRTRIVVNPQKSTSYETDCDAAKFIADNMPQIYSLDDDGSIYSINERPVGTGIIDLAVKAPKDGYYTISAPRLDCDAKLRDLETGDEVDLAEKGYTFSAEAMTYTKRFQLILANSTSSITAPEEAAAAINVEDGAIRVNDANANVKVYSTDGTLIASENGVGNINVPAGVYVVTVNGQSVKVTVNK